VVEGVVLGAVFGFDMSLVECLGKPLPKLAFKESTTASLLCLKFTRFLVTPKVVSGVRMAECGSFGLKMWDEKISSV
jgi:hypothetical protein